MADKDIKQLVEETLASALKDQMPPDGPPIYPTRRQDDAPDTYLVVLAVRENEIIPETDVYNLDVRVVVVAPATAAGTPEHMKLVSDTRKGINKIPKPGKMGECVIKGLALGESRQSDQEGMRGEIFQMVVGAAIE